jgi:hypothetical protein
MAGPLVSKITRSISPKSIFEDLQGKVAATTDFSTGDLLVWDASQKVILPSAETEGSTFLGISDVTVVDGVIKGPYTGITDNNAAVPSYQILGPKYGVYALCVLKTGESLAIGGSVYLDPATGTRGVAASGTKAIGVYVGNSAISSSAAGLEIEVLLGARFPNDVLKF